MRVRALKDHMNDYGGERLKKAKAEYEIDSDADAEILIDAGIVERVKDKR